MSSRILYEKWLNVARAFSPELALMDSCSGQAWTFAELLRRGEKEESQNLAAFPQGHSPEFIFTLLRAWRSNAVTCPIEVNQMPPVLSLPKWDCAHLKLTSGSTGEAKCVAFTAEQLATDPANIVSTMGLRTDWPNLACISLAHSYGFSNLILPLLLHGIPLVLVPAPLPEIIRSAAKQFPSITLAAVPALWNTWHQARAIPSNVKLAISAGAPLPLDLERAVFERDGIKIHNFYGSSECGGIAYDRSPVPRTEANLAGAAIDNVRLSISAAGTLVGESSAVGQTYWPEEKANPALRPGRFETSDLAQIRGENAYPWDGSRI
jgi:acyl-CoA synthetase (AMP-forming)/AMP-acid ligase II